MTASCHIFGTRRPLSVRMAGYDLLARRRPHLGRPGSLLAAIRRAHDRSLAFHEAFTVRVLAHASDPERARELERLWNAQLGTAAPHGFNLMPGGSSLGGPGNAKLVNIRHRGRGRLRYGSLMDAVADINRERQHDGKPALSLGVVYARRAPGWTIEEVLELKPHADGRRQRPLFQWHGRSYDSLYQLAREEGLSIDTARSRLHRARQAGCGSEHDASTDRRAPGPWRRDGVGCGLQRPLELPHPLDPEGDPVDAATFALLSHIPKATVLHRYHRLRGEADDLTGMTRAAVLAAPMRRDDRRVLITLPVPQGPVLEGGVRAVIHQVLNDPAVDRRRDEPLESSAIRGLLRALPGWPDTLKQDALLWAFGFWPTTARTMALRLAAA